MTVLDAAGLVVIASRTLGISTGAALAQMDIAVAEEALAEAWPSGADLADPGVAAAAAVGLMHALLRRRPFPRQGQQVAVAAGLQFLSLNGWRADLDPPATAAVVVEALASGQLERGAAAAWLSPRLTPAPGAPHGTRRAPAGAKQVLVAARRASAGPGRTTDWASRTTPVPGREAPGPGRTTPGPGRTTAGPGRTTPGPGREAAGPGREAVGAGRTTPGLGREAAGLGREAAGAGRTTAGPGRGAAGAGRRARAGAPRAGRRPSAIPATRAPGRRAVAGVLLAVAVSGAALLAAACSRAPSAPAAPTSVVHTVGASTPASPPTSAP